MSLFDSLGGSLGQMALKALPGIIQQVLPAASTPCSISSAAPATRAR